jgi:hypothetical protein
MHAHTRDCPLTCLKPLVSTGAYNALRRGCSSTATGPHPAIGDAEDLYHKEQLAGIRGIGPRRFREIEDCLTRAGLIGHGPPPSPAPADHLSPPAAPDWSGTAAPRRLRTRLIVE